MPRRMSGDQEFFVNGNDDFYSSYALLRLLDPRYHLRYNKSCGRVHAERDRRRMCAFSMGKLYG